MSVLIPATQPNKDSFFFALAGGGGGGSLQSPVVVTPDAASGNATIAVIADPAIVTGQAGLSVISSANSPGTILVGGYGTDYSVGVPSQPVAVAPALPQFEIGVNDGVTAPALTYNGGSGDIILGDGNATAVIQTRNTVAIGDPSAGVNKLLLSPFSGTASAIIQSVASAGTLNLGSSAAYLSTLVVSDVTKNGAAAYVEINGTAGATPLFIAGAQGSGGACYVYPDGTGGTQSLNLGSSTVRQDTLTVIEPVAGTSIVRVNGSGGGTAVQIAGGTTPSVATSAASNGALQLRSSAAGYAGDGTQNGIVLSDNSASNARPLATFNSQIVLPSSNSGAYSGIAGQYTPGIQIITPAGGGTAGQFLDQQGAVLPTPPSGAQYSGLWMYRILTNQPSNASSIQCCPTLTTYWDGALNAFNYGGAATPFFGGSVGITTSTGNVRIIPNFSGSYIINYTFANFSGATIIGMAVQLVQMTGVF